MDFAAQTQTETTVEPKQGGSFIVPSLVAVLLGAGCGALQIGLGDLSSTALAVTVSSMALGCAWPRHPWRWAFLISLCVPVAVLVTWDRHPGRGQLFGTVAILAPALVAAFGGSFMRKLVKVLFTDTDDS